ncbi:MAG: hypothetical protein WCT02_04585 [Candidatus Paceibacterota bacterium]
MQINILIAVANEQLAQIEALVGCAVEACGYKPEEIMIQWQNPIETECCPGEIDIAIIQPTKGAHLCDSARMRGIGYIFLADPNDRQIHPIDYDPLDCWTRSAPTCLPVWMPIAGTEDKTEFIFMFRTLLEQRLESREKAMHR